MSLIDGQDARHAIVSGAVVLKKLVPRLRTGQARHRVRRPPWPGSRILVQPPPVQTKAGLGYHPEMPDDNLAHRRSLLTTALVGALLPKDVPEGHMLRAWLDSWSGLGYVAEEMHEVGYDVRLSRSVFEWSADFCRSDLSQLAHRFRVESGRQALEGRAAGRPRDAAPRGPQAMKAPRRKPDPTALSCRSRRPARPAPARTRPSSSRSAPWPAGPRRPPATG